MNDPVPAPLRWALLAALTAAVLVRAAAGPWVLRVAVLALAGLAALPVLGWLRTLWFAPVAAAGVAGYSTAVLMHDGQAVPVAALVGAVAGGVVGTVAAVLIGRTPALIRPWASLLLVVVVWGVFLPRVAPAPAPPPLLFGVNVASDKALAVLAMVLLALGVWLVSNLARSRAGRQIGAAGSSPRLALMSGATLRGVWMRAGIVSGVLSGFAGVLLAIDAQSVPGVAQFSPATAVAWVAVPLIGGPAWVSGVLVGALVVGGLPAAGAGTEAGIAGIGLAVAALTRGHGIVGAIAERWDRS